VAQSAVTYARGSGDLQPVLVNGDPGMVVRRDGRPVGLVAFTIRGGRIAQVDGINDPTRLALLDLPSPS
jgi:RNA polymerase sigma-70 factor (ECF subfamily)